ncbi:unnamed protein product, partial [Meganyctiphanes norvegica]
MFSFMKKEKEDKKKKDKKDRKEGKRPKDRAALTLDELKRLDEARRSLIGKGRKKKDDKLPSGIVADYMEQFRQGFDEYPQDVDLTTAGTFQELRERYEAMASAQSLHSDSSSDGQSMMSVGGQPPRPPKRGILKTKGEEGEGDETFIGVCGDLDDEGSLRENTIQNELIMYENFIQEKNSRESRHPSLQSSLGSPPLVANGSGPVSPRSPQLIPTSPLQLIPTTSSVPPDPNTPPEPPCSPVPIGEGVGHHRTKTFAADLRLPALVPAQPPHLAHLTIVRSPAGDFGFSLRRAQLTERGPGNTETRRTIVFAEPGAIGRANVTGLLPGDRLLQVNGISVETKTRDEIIELIKASPDSVTLVVST